MATVGGKKKEKDVHSLQPTHGFITRIVAMHQSSRQDCGNLCWTGEEAGHKNAGETMGFEPGASHLEPGVHLEPKMVSGSTTGDYRGARKESKLRITTRTNSLGLNLAPWKSYVQRS